MSKKKQVTIEDMEKAMAIELLPAKELKKQAEVPVDFSALMQKALKYDINLKRKARNNPAYSLIPSYRENRNVSNTLFTVNGYNLVAVPVRKLKYIYFHNLSFLMV